MKKYNADDSWPESGEDRNQEKAELGETTIKAFEELVDRAYKMKIKSKRAASLSLGMRWPHNRRREIAISYKDGQGKIRIMARLCWKNPVPKYQQPFADVVYSRKRIRQGMFLHNSQ